MSDSTPHDPVPPTATPKPKPPPFDAELLSWSALLAQCVRLAQAAVALPRGDDAEGREGEAWRASVAHVIELQAVWFALQRRADLLPDERGLARDRAAVSLDRHGDALRRIWEASDGGMPEGIASLLGDVTTLLDEPAG